MRKHILIAVLSFVSPLTAFAGGGATGGATEFTQIANNTQLVASYAELAQQTVTQFNQYAAMLRNLETMTPPELLGTAAAKLWHDQNMIQTFKNLNTIVVGGQTVAYSLSNLDAQFRQANPGYGNYNGRNYAQLYQGWSDTTLNAVRNSIAMIGAQQQNFASEELLVKSLENASKSPKGQVQAIQAGNNIGVAMIGQMQQLRQLQLAQMDTQNAYVKQQVGRQNAADQAFSGFFNRPNAKVQSLSEIEAAQKNQSK